MTRQHRAWHWSSALLSLPVLVAGCGDPPVDDQGDPTADEARVIDPSRLPPTPHGLRPMYRFSDRDQFPESGWYDPAQRAFYVGSIEHGGIRRVAADGVESDFVAPVAGSSEATLGITIDSTRNRLWVCAIDKSAHLAGTVSVYDLTTQQRLRRFELTHVVSNLPATTTTASCNDIALDDQGNAYVTDRENPFVYYVDFSGSSARVWANDLRLRPVSPTITVGMNGIVFTPDRSALIVTILNPARLMRIPLNDPHQLSEVVLHGNPFNAGTHFLNGPDGVAFFAGSLYIAFGDVAMRVTADDAGWTRANVQRLRGFSGLTAMMVADGALYALTGQAVRWVLHAPFNRPFVITRIDPQWFH